MALSSDGEFKKSDYFRQADEVGEILERIESANTKSVVEVGCGRGFNIRYLAQRFPDANFVGVDISDRNIRAAEKDLRGLANVSICRDDFQSLSEIPDGSVDVVFAVETLCHATDMEKALEAITRKLKINGKLIVFDGFRNDVDETIEDVRKAVTYAEKAMAVPRFWNAPEFIRLGNNAGLVVEDFDDRSAEIMPNLVRLSDLAKGFFKIGPVSRMLMSIIPRGLVANSVAGLLMAVTVQTGAHRYIRISFRKEDWSL